MKKQKGQTLVEAILSLAVISAVITAVVTAVITSLNGATYNRNENLALNYAQEGIDVIRDSKSADYDVFISSYPDNYYCLGKEDNSLTDYSDCDQPSDVNISSRFKRIIYINQSGNLPPSDGSTHKCSIPGFYVASIVSWTDGKCDTGTQCHQVKLESCFSDLNTLPTP